MFYTTHSNVFRYIMFKGFLAEAVTKHPEKFGTGDAMDVVEAIRLIHPTFENTQRHVGFLQLEKPTSIPNTRYQVLWFRRVFMTKELRFI